MNMKKMLAGMLVFIMAGTCPVYAAKDGQKGANRQAYEHADDQAIFNRVGDWFATVGKSDEEKAEIMAERKAQRAQKRAEQEAKKAEKMAEHQMKKAGAKAEKMKGSKMK